MKKTSLTVLFLTAFVQLTFGFYPSVKNFTKEIHGGGTQTWSITQSPSGIMYFANNDGLLEFDGGQWNLYRLRNYSSARSVFYDNDRIYVGGTNEMGYYSCTESGMVYTPLLDSLGLSLTEIWKIGKTPEGNLFFEEKDTRYCISPGKIEQWSFPPLGGGTLTCTAENEEYYAEGTATQGVFIHNKRNGRSIQIDTRSGLQNNTVLSMFFDASGNLWLGLDKGIDYIILDHPIYRLFGDSESFGTGYAFTISGDKAYVGTNMGLFCIDADKLQGNYSDSDFIRVQGIEGQVWSLDKIGDKVFCCHDKGIYIIKDGRIAKYIKMNGAWKVAQIDDDHLLGCSYERMFILTRSGQDWALKGYLEGLDLSSKVFEQDYDGKIWFSHHVQGLYRFSINDDYTQVINLEHLGAKDGFPTDHNNIPHRYRGEIVFSTEGGYWNYDNHLRRAIAIDALNHRFNGTTISVGLYENPERTLRYFSSGAIEAIEYEGPDGYGVIDSLSLRPLVGKRPLGFECYYSLGPQRLIINTEDGFSIVDADRIGKREAAIRNNLFIKEVVLKDDGRTIFCARSKRDGTPILKLKHSENSLGFEFIEPYFQGDKQVEYSCMLEGFDKGFSPYSPVATKEYSQLPHGHYNFVVKSKNQLCGGLEQYCQMEIVITRPWYLSIAAILFYILLGVGLLYLIIYLTRRHYNRKAEILAQKKSEEMQKEQMRLDVESKADDLAASTMDLMRKNELLQNISAQIDKAIEGVKNGDEKDAQLRRLRQVSSLIDENIEHDDNWKKFQGNFDVVYNDFLKRLDEQYPGLSVSDKKICAYIKMDLSSKEIAPLLNMTIRSVEMTRYRLRKKLGLQQGENLTDFLQRF